MPQPVLVIGSSNTDMVVRAPRLPAPGETIIGHDFLLNPGGKGANQAVAAARLGGEVTFVANLGNDLFGKQALEQFHRENIRTEFIQIDAEHPSGVALIGVDAQGENSILVAPGANAHLGIHPVEAAVRAVGDSPIVLVQLEIPLSTVAFAIRCGQAAGGRVVLNPAPAQPLDPSLLPHLYLITPNESEASQLTGILVVDAETARQAAFRLREWGALNVVITMGARGAFLLTGEESHMLAAPAVAVTDTTAAGDCFNGALAVALAENAPLPGAVAFACRAAALSVTKVGAQASLPFRSEMRGYS